MSLLYDNNSNRPAPEDLVTDWYIPADAPAEGFVYPGPLEIVSNNKLATLAPILLALAIEKGKEEFSLIHNERVYRGHRIQSVKGPIYALRRIPNYIPRLDELGLPISIQAILTHKELTKGGLILIVGETGQGKSTTCSATIKARLEDYGSFCLTVEDPPEHPLHGIHKDGRCIQTSVQSGEFADALKGAVRSYPTIGNCILYIGETRDPETAHEALVAATNGHLVFTTLHASDVLSAIKRFIALACLYKNVVDTDVKSMFATTFRLIMHQKLRMYDEKRKLDVSFLFCPNGQNGLAQRIKANQIDQLITDLEAQANLAKANNIKMLLSGWK